MKETRNVTLSVMTWNIYLGADLSPVITAEHDQIPQRVTEVFRQFLATNFPKRAKAIAHQILLKKPDLIGLQEVETWELQPGLPNPRKVKYDFVEILLHILACWGMKYRIAARNWNAEIALPDSFGNTIRLTDSDVILISESSDIEIFKKQEANFTINASIPAAGQTFTVLRGWSAIDVSIKGNMFRLVNTHLDADLPLIQVEQGKELIAGPGKTELPLIFTGDFNSNANGRGTPTYGNLIAEGFQDTWIAAGKGDGFTSFQDADLLNVESLLSERVDLILLKANIDWEAVKAEVVGEAQIDRTHTGLWPSDHAGMAVKIVIENY